MARHSEHSFTSFDGKSIYHQAWLPEGETKGVVILVHGLGEHSGRYQHVADRLTSAGFAVHALDNRGHGKSEGKRVFVKSYDEFMADLTQFRGYVQSQHPGMPLVILGHSMGGNLTVGHVLDNQDGLAGMAVSGAALAVGDDLSPTQIKIFKTIAKVAPGVRPQALDANTISRDPAVVDAYNADPLVHHGKVTAGIGAALIGAMERFPERYDELTLPMLVMHGTDDRLVDISGSKQLAAGAINAEVTTKFYDGLYHEILNEPEQDQVLDDIVAWIECVV